MRTLYAQAEILDWIAVKLSYCCFHVKCLIRRFLMAIFDSFALTSYEICSCNLVVRNLELQYATLSPRSQLIKYFFIFSREKLLFAFNPGV